ncbi:MAG: Maf family protein [Clostridia bacterium]|nr:Maf family protein [Clostridia bacterium]
MEKIILASASPRRKEILEKYNIEFDTIVSDVEENFSQDCTKEQIPMMLALRKALNVETKCTNGIIIAADTIVYKNEVLGKPTDRENAFNMLRKLSDGRHEVITGVAIIRVGTYDKVVFYDTTQVFFKSLSDKDINTYIDTDEIWDKAGAYAIQGKGVELIEKIDGDYYNVMGLPIHKVKLVLDQYFTIND